MRKEHSADAHKGEWGYFLFPLSGFCETISEYNQTPIFFCSAFHSKIIDRHQDGEVSGMMLCYPWCMVHLIEVSGKRVLSWMYKLNTPRMPDPLPPFLSQAKTSNLMSILRDMLNSGKPNHGLAEARVSRMDYCPAFWVLEWLVINWKFCLLDAGLHCDCMPKLTRTPARSTSLLDHCQHRGHPQSLLWGLARSVCWIQ
jgi:hypothetical protein